MCLKITFNWNRPTCWQISGLSIINTNTSTTTTHLHRFCRPCIGSLALSSLDLNCDTLSFYFRREFPAFTPQSESSSRAAKEPRPHTRPRTRFRTTSAPSSDHVARVRRVSCRHFHSSCLPLAPKPRRTRRSFLTARENRTRRIGL